MDQARSFSRFHTDWSILHAEPDIGVVVNGLQIDIVVKYALMGLFTLGVIATVLLKFRNHLAQKWLVESIVGLIFGAL